MNYLIIAVIVIVILCIMYFIQTKNKVDPEELDTTKNVQTCKEYPYKKKYLLTRTEYTFYSILKQKCDSKNILICPKVRMEDFLQVTDTENKMKYRGYIKSRHIDFILCDNKLNMIAGLELDDRSHQQERAKEADQFKDAVFQKINIPLYRVAVGADYKEELDYILNQLA